MSDEFIQEINDKQSTWKAGRHFNIEDYELFKTLASGAKPSRVPRIHKRMYYKDVDIPKSFDAREAWPACADIIGLIRDQSNCGSCWAFGAVAAMSDRVCIHSNATRKVLISAQDAICGRVEGCNGGDPYYAWHLWESDGIVTGGLYNNTQQGCQPYFLPTCNPDLTLCNDIAFKTPDCKKVCDDASVEYKGQKFFGKDVIVFWGEQQIQREILNNGPVEATFSVYSDFNCYKSGIYQHIKGDLIGRHAIKIIGWGEENNVKYWLIANSWNENWGEKGFFKFIRGRNEVGIEDYVTSGLPDFTRF